MDLYISLSSSLSRDMEQMNSVALNIANAATPGFKRWIQPQTDVTQVHQISTLGERDLSAGKLIVTDSMLDVYLPEGIYLAAQHSGQDAFVRGGQLRVSADGHLVNENNSRIQVDGATGPLNGVALISADGRLINQNGETLGHLKLAKSSQAHLLDNGVYRLDNAQDIANGVAVIESGAYEGSNVQITDEMVSILKTMRHLESAQHILKHEDALNERLFSALAKF